MRDFEVFALDTDGCVVQWDAKAGELYNSGQSLKEFGIENLTTEERERVGINERRRNING